jgi:hypothetical protein
VLGVPFQDTLPDGRSLLVILYEFAELGDMWRWMWARSVVVPGGTFGASFGPCEVPRQLKFVVWALVRLRPTMSQGVARGLVPRGKNELTGVVGPAVHS